MHCWSKAACGLMLQQDCSSSADISCAHCVDLLVDALLNLRREVLARKAVLQATFRDLCRLNLRILRLHLRKQCPRCQALRQAETPQLALAQDDLRWLTLRNPLTATTDPYCHRCAQQRKAKVCLARTAARTVACRHGVARYRIQIYPATSSKGLKPSDRDTDVVPLCVLISVPALPWCVAAACAPSGKQEWGQNRKHC